MNKNTLRSSLHYPVTIVKKTLQHISVGRYPGCVLLTPKTILTKEEEEHLAGEGGETMVGWMLCLLMTVM